MERLKAIKEQLQTVFGDMSLAQRISLGVAVAVVLGGLGWVIMSATEVEYRTLYSDVSEETAAKMTEALRKQGIPYKLENPTTIAVPREQVYEARLYVAGLGLTDANGSGYELFDESDFGMTAFTQKINYKRALENELARTIRHLETVKEVRVHLVLPEEALFRDEQEEPTASVVLTLANGRAPGDDQIDSIRYLVASAVEGLEPEQVTVVDNTGRLLARPDGDGLLAGAGAAGSLEASRNVENDLEERIVDLLAPMVGRDHLRAKVRVELDTAQVTETAEIFDPEATAVRSEQRSEETSNNGNNIAAGVPGIGSNLPGRDGAGPGGTAGNASQRTDERVNYEVSKTVRQVTNAGFTIKRLSVAVLVDEAAASGAPVAEGDEEAAEGDEAAAAVAAALTPERVESLVKGAVGFDDARGDTLQVSFESFRGADLASADPLPWYQEPELVVPAVRYLALVLLALVLGFLVMRPLMRVFEKPTDAAVASSSEALEVDAEVVGQRVGDLTDAFGEDELAQLETESPYAKLRAEIIELGKSDIDRTGQVIRQWIRADA
jgi:flagellar M-ring protein FliF